MFTRKSFLISLGAITLLSSVTYVAHTIAFTSTKEKNIHSNQILSPAPPLADQKYIEILLDAMELRLHNGSSSTEIIPILSVGKSGSFYETIGGRYISDYKTELHLSTIGNVYMPYNVHVFGNYFIHGVPYYANGEKVSTKYSGGCIRLRDTDAKKVYDFVEEGIPISISKDNIQEFNPTPFSSSTFLSFKMTTMMVGAINLESLNQDTILGGESVPYKKAKELLQTLLTNGDTRVSKIYADAYDNEKFLEQMNKKAQAIGLSNTKFISVTEPVSTTFEDYTRFMEYITKYKSYMLRTTTNEQN